MHRTITRILVTLLLVALLVPASAFAWSNGPEKNGQAGDGFGTHDWILVEAMHLAGSSADWVDEDAALLASDDPDTVFGDTVNHLFRPTGPFSRGAAQKVADHYHEMYVAHAAGNFELASQHLGWLSHYYSDILVPFHTSVYMEGSDDAEHLSYELKVDEYHRAAGDNRNWITPRSYQAVTDIRAKTVDAAYFSRSKYDSLMANYTAGADPMANSTVRTITKDVLSRAVNDLADIIRTAPTGAGRSVPGNLTAFMSKTYPAQNSLVSANAMCLDAQGRPI
ncbi:MAG: zinc dependent phospholipase C family protein, partial [Actinomycetota bacterium]|nr:zinc dependent phospholipase C family protein [Actinomycetota bacterium]